MDGVFVQPTGVGAEPGDRNWNSTIGSLVDFESPPRGGLLSRREREALRNAHPDGQARFWGVTARHRRPATAMRTGDIVFFTGSRRIRGLGRVGIVLNNAAFGDTLWPPHPDQGSFRHVYSLGVFHELDLPYSEFETRGVRLGGVYNLRAFTGTTSSAILTAFAPEIASLEAGEASAEEIRGVDVERRADPAVEVEGHGPHSGARVRPEVVAAAGGLDVLRGTGALIDEEPAVGDDGAALDHSERLRRFLGATDSAGVLRAARLEQRALRESLGLVGDPDAPSQCGLCGRWVPRRLLATAHVKPRSECTDSERTDVSVVMPACALGCDALYEIGHLSVGVDGRIVTSRRLLRPSHLQSVLREMEGRQAPAWTADRERFFAWHRENRFLGAVDPLSPLVERRPTLR